MGACNVKLVCNRRLTPFSFFRAPESERVLLVVAAQLARDGKVEEATSLLASSTATGCALMRAQLAIEAGDAKQVLDFICLLTRPAAHHHSHIFIINSYG